MSATDLTITEIADSVTGFEEMGVTSQFGKPLVVLQNTDSSMWVRALVFVAKRREGLDEDASRNAALGLAISDVVDYFAPESEDSGKDGKADEPQPESSQPSAS